MKWRRPDSVPFPKVWHDFEKNINGEVKKFWVQDVPEEYKKICIDILCSDFVRDEPMCSSLKVIEDPIVVSEMRKLWEDLFSQNMSLICFTKDKNGCNEIAGLNCLAVSFKDDPNESDKIESKSWKQIYDAMIYIYTCQGTFFDKFNLDFYLNAMGLVVLPEFRGCNIGLELLKCRELMGKSMGIPATLTLFTAIGSQTLAAKAGFEDFVSVPYEDMAKLNPPFVFPNITKHTKNCKAMYKLFK